MDQGLQAVLDYLLSPIVLVLIAVTLLSVVVGIRQAKNIQAEGKVPTGLKSSPLVFHLHSMSTNTKPNNMDLYIYMYMDTYGYIYVHMDTHGYIE